MKRLLTYLKKHPVLTILAPLFKMLEASFELFVPLVVAKMIDTGIKSVDSGYLWQMGGLLILLGIIGFAFSVTAQYLAAKSAVAAGKAMRNDLFAHINTLSFKEIDAIGTSTLINRMTNDINQVQNGVNMFLRLFLRSPFVVFGAMAMAFTVDAEAAFPFVVTIPVLLIVVFAILLITMPLYRQVQKQLDKVLLHTRENLLGIRVVRAFNRQEKERVHFQEESEALYGKQIHVGKISALLNPLTYIIINLGIIAVLWSGGKQVSSGHLSQGQVIALINYMSQILVELIKLANLIILLSRAMASMNRVNSIFDIRPSISRTGEALGERMQEETPVVQFTEVSFAYSGSGENAVSGLNFAAMQGQTIGIIGGTGSGKSTLVNLIPRFYDATEGTVRINGRLVTEINPVSLRRKIGMVPQKALLFSGSLRENMKWGNADANDGEIYAALHTAQAGDLVESKEQGLDFEIAQNGGNLSGGQKQRLTIARALVRKPEILILDDSASALDFATDARLRKAIKKNTGNMTVFLVSQRVSTIQNADQILVMDDGQIVDTGTHSELLARNDVYQEICASQLSEKEVSVHVKA